MTTSARQISTASSRPSPLAQWLLRLTEPHPSIQATDERRKVRILLSISLVLIVLLVVGVTLVLLQLTIRPEQPLRHTLIYISPAFLAALIGVPAYFVGRTPQYLRAAVLLVSALTALRFGMVLVVVGTAAYVYISIPLLGILLASVFLDIRTTRYITAILTIVLLFVMTIRYPVDRILFVENVDVVQADVFSSAIMLFCFGGVGLCIALLGRRGKRNDTAHKYQG